MSSTSIALLLVSVTLSAVAQVAFKFGVSSEPAAAARMLLGPLAIIATPGVAIGLALYGVGTILWLRALAGIDLSQAYPFVGVGFALTTFAGWWLFADQITYQRLGGIVLIVFGIVMVARS